MLKKLQAPDSGFTPAGAVAWVYMGLGDKDRAFQWFTKACDENHHWLNYIDIWPVYDGLRQDPRMAVLTEKLRLE